MGEMGVVCDHMVHDHGIGCFQGDTQWSPCHASQGIQKLSFESCSNYLQD